MSEVVIQLPERIEACFSELSLEIRKYIQSDAAAFDANVDRLKACEHIADGDEGWQVLRNECLSTAAVARLRDEVERLREENERYRRSNADIVRRYCHRLAGGKWKVKPR